jgi:hypothetical protein
MISRYFSVITPQQAPMPRAAWHCSALATTTALKMAQFSNCGISHTARPSITMVATELGRLPNRLRRIQGTRPSVLTGAGRGSMETKVVVISSLLDRRAGVVPIHDAEVASDVVRYTSMISAMHSTARPVWLMAVLLIDTTSG